MIRFIFFIFIVSTNLYSKEEKTFLAIHPLGLIFQQYAPTITLTKEEKAFLKKHPNIIIGSNRSKFPYVYETNDKKIIGLNVDILNRINELTGANFQLELGNWNQVVNKAKEKKIDGITPSFIYEEGKKFFNFSIPFFSHSTSVVVKHGNPLDIKSIKDLENKTIAIQSGNIFLKKLVEEKFTKSHIIYRDSYETVFEDVIYGIADATINEAPTVILKNEKGLPYLNRAFTLEDKTNLVFSIRKDWPEAVSILNKAIKVISKDELEELRYKWLGNFQFDLDSKGLSTSDKEYINKKKKILICADPTWYSFDKKSINDENITIRFLDVILKRINLKKELVLPKTWEESLTLLKNGKCDLISAMLETKKKSDSIKFTKPYTSYPNTLVTHKITPYLYNLDDLKGKKVVAIKESAHISILNKYNNIKLTYVSDSPTALKMIQDGKAYAYMDLLPNIIPFLNQGRDIKINRELNSFVNISMGVRSGDLQLFNIIEKSLNSIDGIKKREIINNLIKKSYEKKANNEKILQVIFTLLGVTLLVIFWNFQLKKSVQKALLKNKEQEGLLYHYSKQDAMKDLVGNISHQWKQPVNELSSILFFLETKIHLKQDISQKEIKEVSIKSRSIIDYLSKTVSTFSNFYVQKNSCDYIEIQNLLKQALFITEGSLKKYRTKINLEIQDKELKIKGEELQQAILAILNNAKNIIIERDISNPIIKIRLYQKDENIILEIEDNFGGIKHIDYIFDLGTTTSKNGSGLGLYISKRIIQDKYKGELGVENIREGGMFTISLPM